MDIKKREGRHKRGKYVEKRENIKKRMREGNGIKGGGCKRRGQGYQHHKRGVEFQHYKVQDKVDSSIKVMKGESLIISLKEGWDRK